MDRRILGSVGFAAALLALSGYAYADNFAARLTGFQEIGGLGAGETGAIFSNGRGRLRLDVSDDAINYELSYRDLGSAAVAAHIHFGKFHVAGGVMVFLCGNGPSGTPACPPDGGTVTGTLTADSVVGPAAQNINPGDFAAVLAALRSNTAYANIHTAQFPAGEIRGQVRPFDTEE